MNNHPISTDGPCTVRIAAHAAPDVPRPSSLAPLPSRPRRGFTLIELMVVMAIMATLAAVMAYAVAGAQEMAQIAKTRALIARLNTLVMQKYESYRTRRLPIVIPGEVYDRNSGKTGPTPIKAIQTVRCDVIRQLLRMEMPERWTDLDDPAPITIQDGTTNPGTVYYDPSNTNQAAVAVMQPTAVFQAYRVQAQNIPYTTNPVVFNPSGTDTAYEGAKCLYLIVTLGLDEADAMENFSEGDIVDYDHSGHKVFVDAWGKPIGFLRWAPGFISPLQPAAPPPGSGQKDQRMPDQTDPAGIYGMPNPPPTVPSGKAQKQQTFALYPLIYSAGPDGYVDMVSKSGSVFHYVNTTNPRNNPFASMTDTTNFPAPPAGPGPIGTAAIFDDQGNYTTAANAGRGLGISDNITNHSIGAR